ncbi:MAG TPA: hydroxymethylbilane synthase [Cellulomonas sp.]
MTEAPALRIGTRGSALAVAQTSAFASALRTAAGCDTRLVTVTTEGDRSAQPLTGIGGEGVFATGLRHALLAGQCDVVVHSLKDLPTAPWPGLIVAAIPPRADARDALCARDGLALDALPAGARVGTGSPRRAAQLRARRPDVAPVPLRGNVDTRLAAVARGDLDAVLLAAAGLGRLGRADAITDLLALDRWPTAPGQGALAVEVRAGEEPLVLALDDAPTRLAVTAERRVLALLEAGCTAPVGVHATTDGGVLHLAAAVYDADGRHVLWSVRDVPTTDVPDPADRAAQLVARELLDAGAADLMGVLR